MKYKYTGKMSGSLRQIIATKDFGNVKKGQIGGYIKAYSNLDQNDDSWIDSGYVSGTSHITDNSIIVNSYIHDSYIRNTKIEESKISNSDISREDGNVINIKNSCCVDSKISHNLIEVDKPICIKTSQYDVYYTGFEMVNGKKIHYVSAGCQDHSVEDWLNKTIRTKIMRTHGFPKNREQEFLHYLQAIIVRHCGK